MKTFPASLLSLATAFFFTLSVMSPALAQDPTLVTPAPTVSDVPAATTTTTVTTTTGPDETKTTKTTVTTVPATPPPVVPLETTTATVTAGQHVAEIEIIVTRGKVGAYFGRAPRGEKFSVGDASFHIKLPSTATVTKLARRDNSSDGATAVTADNPWHVTVPFSGTGRYVFNMVDFDDDPVVAEALVKVDGVVKFEGHGRDDEIKNWPSAVYGDGVHRTGSREIAFDVE